MTEDYFRRFPPTRFPRNRDESILFPSADLLDNTDYIESHGSRKWEIQRAKDFLRLFNTDRGNRERLLARLLKHHHHHNTVLAMTLNRGFCDLLHNWVKSCDRNDIEVRSWTVIAALDDYTVEKFEQLGFVVFNPGNAYGRHGHDPAGHYGDLIFKDMMFAKNAIVQDLLNIGFDVLFQDVDMVWRKDPRDVLMHPERKILEAQFMYDGPNLLFAPLYVNSGFFYLRNTSRCRKFWQQVHDNFDKVYSYSSQQRVVNKVLVHQYFRGLKLDVLIEEEFANGHLFTWDDVSGLPPDPYVVHCSWTSNLEHKMKKYRLADLWYL